MDFCGLNKPNRGYVAIKNKQRVYFFGNEMQKEDVIQFCKVQKKNSGDFEYKLFPYFLKEDAFVFSGCSGLHRLSMASCMNVDGGIDNGWSLFRSVLILGDKGYTHALLNMNGGEQFGIFLRDFKQINGVFRTYFDGVYDKETGTVSAREGRMFNNLESFKDYSVSYLKVKSDFDQMVSSIPCSTDESYDKCLRQVMSYGNRKGEMPKDLFTFSYEQVQETAIFENSGMLYMDGVVPLSCIRNKKDDICDVIWERRAKRVECSINPSNISSITPFMSVGLEIFDSRWTDAIRSLENDGYVLRNNSLGII